MWNISTVSLPNSVAPNRVYTLVSDVPAMQILAYAENDTHLYPVSRLPRGAEIEACGEGFNDRTVKVMYEGQYYFVFLDDLEAKRMASAIAAHA